MNLLKISSTPRDTIQPPATPRAQNTLTGSNPDNAGAVDFDDLMARVENDTALLDEMIGLYLDSSPRLVNEIELGVRTSDGLTVQRAAHALKGALQNLSAGPSAKAALQLEKLGRSGDLTSVEQTLVDLKTELARLQSELTSRPKVVAT